MTSDVVTDADEPSLRVIGPRARNGADGRRTVLPQVGVLHTGPADVKAYYRVEHTHAESLRVGLALLRAGAADRARRLLAEASGDSGLAGEAQFLRILAIVHDKSLGDLTAVDRSELNAVTSRVADLVQRDLLRPDAFTAAVQVLRDLVHALDPSAVSNDSGPAAEAPALNDVLRQFESLPVEATSATGVDLDVRAEAAHHAVRLLTGVPAAENAMGSERRLLQTYLDTSPARGAADDRNGTGAEGAWADPVVDPAGGQADDPAHDDPTGVPPGTDPYRHGVSREAVEAFFTPDPAPPLLTGWPTTTPPGRWGVSTTTAVVLLLLALVLLGSLSRQWPGRIWFEAGAAIAFALGLASYVAPLTREQRLHARRRKRYTNKERRLGVLDEGGHAPELTHHFAVQVNAAFRDAFARRAPSDVPGARKWLADSQPIMVHLARETIATYRHSRLHTPDRLAWLAEFHAQDVFRRWKAGRIEHFPKAPEIGVAGWVLIGLFGGASSMLTIDVARALLSVERWDVALLGLFLAAVGLGLGPQALYRNYCETEWLRTERWYARRRHDRETERWLSLVEARRNRPSDAQIGGRLDAALLEIRKVALDRYRLGSGHVLTHLMLTEAAPGCAVARVPGGPARYSHYLVHVFLFTDEGIRYSMSRLDLTPPDDPQAADFVHEEVDTRRFRYGAVVSAAIGASATITDGRATPARQVAALSREARVPLPVRDRVFRVVFGGGESVEVALEDFSAWGDGPRIGDEDPAVLHSLALDAAGVRYAAALFDQVATDGESWPDLFVAWRGRPTRVRHDAPTPEPLAPAVPAEPADTEPTQDDLEVVLDDNRWHVDRLNPVPLEATTVVMLDQRETRPVVMAR